MKYQVYNAQGEKVKEIDLKQSVFELPVNSGLVHQAAMAQFANSRHTLAHTKDRSQVRGGGRKPWRQKGTGRARHGSIRSPLWVGGGVTFGPTKDKNFTKKINKKMKRKALFICLSDRAKEQNLVIVEKFEVKDNKTKEFVAFLKNFKTILQLKKKKKQTKINAKAEKIIPPKDEKNKTSSLEKFDIKDYNLSLLVVTAKEIKSIIRIAKNIPGLKVIHPNSLNLLDVLSYRKLLLTVDALPIIYKTYLK